MRQPMSAYQPPPKRIYGLEDRANGQVKREAATTIPVMYSNTFAIHVVSCRSLGAVRAVRDERAVLVVIIVIFIFNWWTLLEWVCM